MQIVMDSHLSNTTLGKQTSQVNEVQQTPTVCEICDGSDNMQILVVQIKIQQILWVMCKQREAKNYGKTYNPSYLKDPNFFWGGNQNKVQGQNQYKPHGNPQGYQGQMQREKPKPQSGNMSVKEMLNKTMENQAQLTDNVRNNHLATKNLEKQFGQLTTSQNSRQQGGYLATQIQILNRSML